MSETQPSVPYGYCECGCGQETTVSKYDRPQLGYVKGKPRRYVRGHATRGKPVSAETRALLSAVSAGLKRSPETRARMSAAQMGERGSQWRGGRSIREGRVMLYVGREHPMADVYGYAYEHRLVFANASGRMLTRSDVVHHVDCDPTNNALDNLVVLTGSEHNRVHNLIRNQGAHPVEALRRVVT